METGKYVKEGVMTYLFAIIVHVIILPLVIGFFFVFGMLSRYHNNKIIIVLWRPNLNMNMVYHVDLRKFATSDADP